MSKNTNMGDQTVYSRNHMCNVAESGGIKKVGKAGV